MAVGKSFLILFFITLCLTNDANADGWKFWKKNQNSESSSLTSTAAPSTKTSTVEPALTVNKGIASANDPALAIGVGSGGNTIKNNPRPQKPNPGTEVGQDFPGSQPNRLSTNIANAKSYREWAVDLTGAGDPANFNPKASGSSPRPSTQPPKSSSAQNHSGASGFSGIAAPKDSKSDQKSSAAVTIPGNAQNNNQKPLVINPTPGSGPRPPVTTSATGNGQKPPVSVSTPGSVQKSSTVTPPSPTGGKSWAEVAGNGNRPGSSTPTLSLPHIQSITPTRPTRPTASFVSTDSSATTIYRENPVYSKGNTVTDEDLIKLSEALFLKDKNNAWKHITLNIQKETSGRSKIDEAEQPLLTVDKAALQIPTIERILTIYDNYHLDTTVNEHITPLQRDEEALLVDTFLSTNVMSAAMRFLSDKGFVKRDYYEYKFLLRQIWFSLYSRGEGKVGSSGFEHVFMSELKLSTEVSGLHNWIYFNAEEVAKRADYLGYIKKLELSDKAVILKLHAKFNGFDKPITTMFVGTSPELEMALYTVCFFVRPDQKCPVQIGGKKFDIITHKFRYRGRDVISTAYPEI